MMLLIVRRAGKIAHADERLHTTLDAIFPTRAATRGHDAREYLAPAALRADAPLATLHINPCAR